MRGDGRIYRRPGSAMWWLSYYHAGKEVRESTGTDDERKAQKALRKRLAQIRTGKFLGLDAERLTVETLIADYLGHLELRGARGVPSARSTVAPLLIFFAGTKAAAVSSGDVQRFTKERLEAGDSNATCNRRLQALRAAFRLALKQERITRSPWTALLDESDNVRKEFYEADEVDRLASSLPVPVDDITRFAFLTGWRRGEITSLRWKDVDRRAHEIWLKTSKTREGRVIPVEAPELKAIVVRAWERRRYIRRDGEQEVEAVSEYVFHDGQGQPRGDFKKSWRTAHKTAGIPLRRFHDLRHSFARHMRRAGVPVHVVMTLGGWKTDSMLRRYDVVNADDGRDAQRRLAEHFETVSVASNVVSIGTTSKGGEKR